MKRLGHIALWFAALAFVGQSRAQAPEIAVELPGGMPLEMVWIKPGTFLMGSPDSERERWGAGATGFETPQHPVTISRGFYFGKYELTQEQWSALMDSQPWETYFPNCARCPVVDVHWDQYQEFIRRLNAQNTDLVFRLPTEAEWEYAAKAGTTTTWPFGNSEDQLDDYAWYRSNTGCREDRPECGYREVGLKKPNPWGLYDIYGNVWEWTVDFWLRRYTTEPQVDVIQSVVPDGREVLRVMKGGGSIIYASGVRPSKRSSFDLGGGTRIGIRLLAQPSHSTAITPTTWGQLKHDIPH